MKKRLHSGKNDRLVLKDIHAFISQTIIHYKKQLANKCRA
jgi:hypothetical protein